MIMLLRMDSRCARESCQLAPCRQHASDPETPMAHLLPGRGPPMAPETRNLEASRQEAQNTAKAARRLLRLYVGKQKTVPGIPGFPAHDCTSYSEETEQVSHPTAEVEDFGLTGAPTTSGTLPEGMLGGVDPEEDPQPRGSVAPTDNRTQCDELMFKDSKANTLQPFRVWACVDRCSS